MSSQGSPLISYPFPFYLSPPATLPPFFPFSSPALPPSIPNSLHPPIHPGYHNIDLELQTPSDLNYQPPTPLQADDFFSEGEASIDSPSKTTLTRPSDLSLTQTTSTSSSDPTTVAPGPTAPEPHIVVAEDTSLRGERGSQNEGFIEEDTELSRERVMSYECPGNERRAVEGKRETEEQDEALEKELKSGQGVVLEGQERTQEISTKADPTSESGGREEEEEEEEMTQERLQSLLEDIKLEGGSEDEEMTEERVNAILNQVRQAEKDLCSVPGWRSETSSVVVEQQTPGHIPDTEASHSGRYCIISSVYRLVFIHIAIKLVFILIFTIFTSLCNTLNRNFLENLQSTGTI